MKATVGQAAIGAICRDIAPWLKSKGFRKRQSTFWKIEDTHSYQFAFQGWWTNTRDSGVIDIPIGLIWNEADKLREDSPLKMPRPYYKCTGYSKLRLGRPSRQIGWSVDRGTDLKELCAEVEAVVRKDVFAWFAFGNTLVKVLQADRSHPLERRRFFLSLLMHSGYTSNGFGADSLLRAGCSLPLLRKLAKAADKSGHKIRRMDQIERMFRPRGGSK